MKKLFVALMLFTMTVPMLGCSSKPTTPAPTDSKDKDAKDKEMKDKEMKDKEGK